MGLPAAGPTDAGWDAAEQQRVPGADAGAGDDAAGETALDAMVATVPSASASAVEPEPTGCRDGMVLVRGQYCAEVAQPCLGYLDPPGRYHEYRCREYVQPAKCVSARISMEFCIDAHEYTPPGQELPAHFVSFEEATRICGAAGKRMCRESEWNFACEGEQMLPYPYGFRRDPSICHADRTDILEDGGRRVRDLRKPSGQMQRCKSPFGVFDMSGNMEELVAADGPGPLRPIMKGDWWHPGRNHCRARQTFHNAVYKGVETGFRCCADVTR